MFRTIQVVSVHNILPVSHIGHLMSFLLVNTVRQIHKFVWFRRIVSAVWLHVVDKHVERLLITNPAGHPFFRNLVDSASAGVVFGEEMLLIEPVEAALQEIWPSTKWIVAQSFPRI